MFVAEEHGFGGQILSLFLLFFFFHATFFLFVDFCVVEKIALFALKILKLCSSHYEVVALLAG